MKAKYKTREEWLTAALSRLRPLFEPHKVPEKVRVSCGFPSENPLGKKRRRIGECWADKASQGRYFEIFISPVLSKPGVVLDTLVHEMVHATVGLKCGHKGPFKQMALSIGLNKGKMPEAGAGPELMAKLMDLAKELGKYPHHQLDAMTKGKVKKDQCRLLKAECPECGYVIRVTRKWIDEAGLPTCPCGGGFEESGKEKE